MWKYAEYQPQRIHEADTQIMHIYINDLKKKGFAKIGKDLERLVTFGSTKIRNVIC